MALGHYIPENRVQGFFPGGKHPIKREAKGRRAAMWREGLRARVRNLKLPGSQELGRCLFSSDGKGVVNFVMLDRSPMGIMMVRFPLEVETRRAKFHFTIQLEEPNETCRRAAVCPPFIAGAGS